MLQRHCFDEYLLLGGRRSGEKIRLPKSDALVGRGHPEETFCRILGALKGRVIRGAVCYWAHDAGEQSP
jgi:hypothetical protein